MWTPQPTPKTQWQGQQRNVSSTAQASQLNRADFKRPETTSSMDNVWRSTFAQWNGNIKPFFGAEGNAETLSAAKALPQWSSQLTRPTKNDEENKSGGEQLVLKKSSTAEPQKRAYKRRHTSYTRPEELTKISSDKQCLSVPPVKRARRPSTVDRAPRKVVKKPKDNLTAQQERLVADAAHWEKELCRLTPVEGDRARFYVF